MKKLFFLAFLLSASLAFADCDPLNNQFAYRNSSNPMYVGNVVTEPAHGVAIKLKSIDSDHNILFNIAYPLPGESDDINAEVRVGYNLVTFDKSWDSGEQPSYGIKIKVCSLTDNGAPKLTGVRFGTVSCAPLENEFTRRSMRLNERVYVENTAIYMNDYGSREGNYAYFTFNTPYGNLTSKKIYEGSVFDYYLGNVRVRLCALGWDGQGAYALMRFAKINPNAPTPTPIVTPTPSPTATPTPSPQLGVLPIQLYDRPFNQTKIFKVGDKITTYGGVDVILISGYGAATFSLYKVSSIHEYLGNVSVFMGDSLESHGITIKIDRISYDGVKATVFEYPLPIEGASVFLKSYSGHSVATVFTNSRGMAFMRDLVPGAYSLSISKTGFITDDRELEVREGYDNPQIIVSLKPEESTTDFTIDLNKGWNLVSYPVYVGFADKDFFAEKTTTTCGSLKVYQLYRYFDTNAPYYQELWQGLYGQAPHAYWVKSPSACSITLKDALIDAVPQSINFSIRLSKGWNMFGVRWFVPELGTFDWEKISKGSCQIKSGPWSWENGEWIKATALEVGKGYFVKADGDCILTATLGSVN